MSKTSILVNAAACGLGGAVQVSIGFIHEVIAVAGARGWSLTLAVAPAVAEMVASEAHAAGIPMEVFNIGPGPFWSGRETRRRLRQLAMDSKAQVVFTVFGPSYVRFPIPELMGLADGFAIAPVAGCYANHSWIGFLSTWVKSALKCLALHTGDYFWVETETAKAGLVSRAHVRPDKVSVISNGVNDLFVKALIGAPPATTGDILFLGSGYAHKNHKLILSVTKLLEKCLPNNNWRFIVTLQPGSRLWLELSKSMVKVGLGHRLHNLGVLNLAECAAAFESATVVFHPSLLEIFSATYVEAMAARRPLVVSDRPFAHEICGDAAMYFDPVSPQSATNVLSEMLTNATLRDMLVQAGTIRLSLFPGPGQRNSKLCDLLAQFVHDFSDHHNQVLDQLVEPQ